MQNKTIKSHNPSMGEIFCEFPISGKEEVANVVKIAEKSFVQCSRANVKNNKTKHL